MDESEAAPNIPLVLDEELDAMKMKISQIKSDIQREKVGERGGRLLEQEWAAAPRTQARGCALLASHPTSGLWDLLVILVRLGAV